MFVWLGGRSATGRSYARRLDREERESVDSNPGSVRRFRSPPPIRGPPETHTYTDNDEEEEEGKDDIAALRE